MELPSNIFSRLQIGQISQTMLIYIIIGVAVCGFTLNMLFFWNPMIIIWCLFCFSLCLLINHKIINNIFSLMRQGFLFCHSVLGLQHSSHLISKMSFSICSSFRVLCRKTESFISYCLGFSVYLTAVNHFHYSFSHCSKSLLHLISTLRWSLIVTESIAGSEFLSLLSANLTTR